MNNNFISFCLLYSDNFINLIKIKMNGSPKPKKLIFANQKSLFKNKKYLFTRKSSINGRNLINLPNLMSLNQNFIQDLAGRKTETRIIVLTDNKNAQRNNTPSLKNTTGNYLLNRENLGIRNILNFTSKNNNKSRNPTITTTRTENYPNTIKINQTYIAAVNNLKNTLNVRRATHYYNNHSCFTDNRKSIAEQKFLKKCQKIIEKHPEPIKISPLKKRRIDITITPEKLSRQQKKYNSKNFHINETLNNINNY